MNLQKKVADLEGLFVRWRTRARFYSQCVCKVEDTRELLLHDERAAKLLLTDVAMVDTYSKEARGIENKIADLKAKLSTGAGNVHPSCHLSIQVPLVEQTTAASGV